MSLATAFQKIALACDMVSTLPGDVAVTLRDGCISARNVSLVASQPLPDGYRDLEFVTTSYDLRDLLRRMEDPRLSRKENYILARSGKSWAKLPLLDVNIDYEPPRVEQRTCDREFVVALLASGNFTTNDKSRLFMRSVRVMGDRTFATNGQCAYSHSTPKVADHDFSVPGPVIEFLRRRWRDVTHWGISDTEIAFWFEDGGWVRGARLNTEIPDRFVAVLNHHYQKPQPLPDGWKVAFEKWYDVAEDVIDVYPDRLFGRRNRTEHTLEISTPLSVERASFDAKLLASVVEVADSIDFTAFPNPVPFCSDKGYGIFLGRTTA